MSDKKSESEDRDNVQQEDKMKCGIVMPISSIDGCDENHWQEVLDIVKDAIFGAGFEGELVSLAADVGVIHKRIVQNLYDNPVVVCDVSGKNPNVMFELGLRLAFDKPTIIIKDDATNYSFDTSPIEHLEYPRDLRFSQIVDFKDQLKEKIGATYVKSTEDRGYSPFLKHFGDFKVAHIDSEEISLQDFVIKELREIKDYIYGAELAKNNLVRRTSSKVRPNKKYIMSFDSLEKANSFIEKVPSISGVKGFESSIKGEGCEVVLYLGEGVSDGEMKEIEKSFKNLF